MGTIPLNRTEKILRQAQDDRDPPFVMMSLSNHTFFNALLSPQTLAVNPPLPLGKGALYRGSERESLYYEFKHDYLSRFHLWQQKKMNLMVLSTQQNTVKCALTVASLFLNACVNEKDLFTLEMES